MAAAAPPREAGWGVLGLVAGAQFMVVLDVSVVNVALPTIRRALDLPPGAVPWVANAYAVVFAGLLLLGGRLGDVWGRARVFTGGLALFTAASLLGGLAWGPWSLVCARALQGVGAALVAPTTLALLTTTYARGPRRTRALAVWAALGALGGAAGSVLGGVLTALVSWRAILLVNVAAGAVLLPRALRLPAGRDTRGTRGTRGTHRHRGVDVPGALLATVGVAALTHAVGRLQQHPWHDAATLAGLATGTAALAWFVGVERRRGGTALFPLSLLRLRSVSVGSLVMLLSGACLQIPVWYFLTFFMQDVLGYTALQTGLGFLPHTLLGVALGLTLTPWLMRRVPSRLLVAAGALTTAAGFTWQGAVDAASGYAGAVLGPAVVLSLGGALFVTPLTSLVVSEVAEQDTGAVSGLATTAKQLGGVLGLAALVAVAGVARTPAEVYAATGLVFAVMGGVLVAVAVLALALPADRATVTAGRPRRGRRRGR
jgi:MFS family permease